MIQENRAAPDALNVGDFVSWNSSGGRARGRITRIERDGRLNVPNSSFFITGTEEDPAALIRLFRDGEATDTIVGHLFSTLTRIEAITERSRQQDELTTGRKQLLLTSVKLKFADTTTGKFGGYASVFGGIDSYNDTIMRGAYKSVIQAVMDGSARMPKMFVNHKSFEVPIGKWTKMYEDEKGLYIEGELTPGNPEAAIVKAAMQHETIDGLSIGYMLKPDDVEFSDMDGKMVRVIKNVSNLSEVSVVTFPADDSARVDLTSVKSALDQINSIKELEDFLREAGGFSKSLATATASRAKRLFSQSESEKSKLPDELQRMIAVNLQSSRTL